MTKQLKYIGVDAKSCTHHQEERKQAAMRV